MSGIGAVWVMCAARPGASAGFMEVARELGERLAVASVSIVYGGGGVGVMGALAEGALAASGRVHGVMPRDLASYGLEHDGLTNMRIVENVAQQQAELLARADAIIALPGGFGTLYELWLAIAAAQLGLHNKPILLVNVGGYYDHVLATLERVVEQGFATREDMRLVHRFGTVEDAMTALVELRDRIPGARLLASMTENRERARELDAIARQLVGTREDDGSGTSTPSSRYRRGLGAAGL